MNARKSTPSWKSALRIIWAITRKDILDAFRNKNIIALFASSLFIVILYRALPLLEGASEKPYLLVCDAGNSSLVAALEASPNVYLFTYPSEDEMKAFLVRGDVPELGLMIPAGFDQSVQVGQSPTLQGYVVNWVTAEQVSKLERIMEEEIGGILGRDVDIQTADNVVYMTPKTDGYGVSVGLALVLVIVMIGATSIPHLMMEEKKNHTIETLLISPASPVHVVSAKALTGLFFCMVGGGFSLAVNYFIVLHWWLALLAVLCGALFTVTLGLLLGIIVEDRAQLSLIAWIFLLPLIIPLILSLFEDLLPATIISVMRAIPSTVMFNLLRSSFAYSFDWREILSGAAWLLACTGIGLGAVMWVMQRQSKHNEGSPLTLRPLMQRPTSAQSASPAARQPANRSSASIKPLVQISTSQQSTAGLSQNPAENKIGKPPRSGSLPIIAAIAVKDIRDAIHNKTLVSILLGVMVVILSGLALPSLLGLVEKPAMVVYDPGRSTSLREMAASPDFRQLIVDSPEGMQERIGASTEVVLGLVWPQNFDQRVGSGATVEVEGYVVHWAKTKQAAEIVSFFEEQLSRESGSKIKINVASQRAYPSARPEGHQNQVVTSTLATALMCIGFLLSPFLIIEEKENHTFSALLVSPASFVQVIAGKFLVGIVYCLIAALAVLLFTHHLVVQWHILLLAILLGAAFATGLGILLGLLCDSQATLAVWGGLALMILLVPGMMRYFDISNWPAVMQTIINMMPATALATLSGIALSNHLPTDVFWQSAQSLLAFSVIVYALVAWVMQRSRQRGIF